MIGNAVTVNVVELVGARIELNLNQTRYYDREETKSKS